MGLSENVEDLLKIGTGIFWSLAYILIIVRGFQDRTYGMPLVALCANIAWEFVFTVVYPRDAPQSYINLTWLLLDVVIVYQALRYGPEELKALLPKRWFYPLLGAGVVLSLLLIVGISEEFQSWNGMYSAFAQTLLMSVLFIFMLLGRDDVRGQSMYVAIFKLLGTLLVAIMFYFRSPGSLLMNTLYVAILIADLAYCGMLYMKYRALGRNPWRGSAGGVGVTPTKLA